MFERIAALQGVGRKGLARIKQSTAVVVGAGALGTRVLEELASMGVGRIRITDRDIVEESNLSSQRLFTKKDIGVPKAHAAKKALEKAHPETRTEALALELDCSNASLLDAGIVVDCTDNLEARRLINEWCKKNKKTWIHGSVAAARGYAACFRPESFCFECVFGAKTTHDSCETIGLFPPAASMVASLQSALFISLALGRPVPESLFYVDASSLRVEALGAKKNPVCSVCSGRFSAMKEAPPRVTRMCGGLYQVRTAKGFGEIKRLLGGTRPWKEIPGALIAGPFTLFRDSRVLVKARTEREAFVLLKKHSIL